MKVALIIFADFVADLDFGRYLVFDGLACYPDFDSDLVDYLAFGSECGDIKILTDIADLLTQCNKACKLHRK